MIVFASLILGAGIGAARAKARGGNGRDMAQYAAIHAIILGIAGVFLTVALARMG